MPINLPDAPEFERGRPRDEQLTAARLNALVGLCNELKQQVNRLEGQLFERQRGGTRTVPVKVGAEISGQTGRHAGRILPPNVYAKDDPGALSADDLGADPGYDDAEVWDVSQATTDDDTSVRMGRVAGYKGDGKAIVLVDGAGGGLNVDCFKITGATQDGTNKRWIYVARKQVKAATGYGGWANDPADSTSYSLYNSIEDMNTATGLYGAGVNSANLTGTYALQRIPDGAVVFAVKQIFTVGEGTFTEYWFSGYNGIDGACP